MKPNDLYTCFVDFKRANDTMKFNFSMDTTTKNYFIGADTEKSPAVKGIES